MVRLLRPRRSRCRGLRPRQCRASGATCTAAAGTSCGYCHTGHRHHPSAPLDPVPVPSPHHARFSRRPAVVAYQQDRECPASPGGCWTGPWIGPGVFGVTWHRVPALPPVTSWSLDDDAQPVAGRAERVLDVLVGVAYGEDEAQVPVPPWERAAGWTSTTSTPPSRSRRRSPARVTGCRSPVSPSHARAASPGPGQLLDGDLLLNTFFRQSPPAGNQDRGPSGRVSENRSILDEGPEAVPAGG